MSPHLQARFRILKLLAEEPDLTQRELAVRLGVSLGKSNYLLKALMEKGLIKLGNFQRSESKLRYVYLLTPAGIRERIRLASAYLARKEEEYDALKAEIEELKGEARSTRNGRKAA
jgi:EPS-associated MarR family transcriptional regulator